VRHCEILFVENTKTHIDTARDVGWQTFLYDPTQVEESNEALKKVL
jgi:FMN phosphatase YigB (HAD superfamily)